MSENVTVQDNRGLSLIDVIIGVAIMTILFVGIFGLFRSSLTVLFDSKARAGATALLEQRMEYIRSLSYRDVGTKEGIVGGILEGDETITFNNVRYDRRTFVQYYDDPEDGTGANDSNNVTQDYKRVKVAVGWRDDTGTSTVESASYIVPNGEERSEGGGILSFRIFDAVGDPVENAEIHIENNSLNPPIDETTFTDDDGETTFQSASSASGYEITVNKSGYSKAQTYDETDTNVAPDPGHLTVSTSTITSASFAIDVLSTIDLKSVTPIKRATWTTDFADTAEIASSSNVSVGSSGLELAFQPNGYATSGVAYTTEIGTSSLYQWGKTSFQSTTTADTDFRLYLTEKTAGGYDRLSDSELNGNDSGFGSLPVDISSISTSTHDRLALELRLSTSNTSTSPQIGTTTTSYSYGRDSLANAEFLVRGEKSIGETSDGNPIYKHQFSTTTDSNGLRTLPDLEWDTYHFTPTPTSSKRITSACPSEPFGLVPATTTDLTLAVGDIESGSGNTLRAGIEGAVDDTAITDATTTLKGGGSEFVQRAGPCGNVFFSDLDGDTSYELTVSSDGYSTTTVSDISIEGAESVVVELVQN